MSETPWYYEKTRLWTDENGQEWVCIPWDPNSTYPEQLRIVAAEWDAENERESR